MQQEHSDFLSTSCWSCIVPYNITPGSRLSTATDLWSESSFQMDARGVSSIGLTILWISYLTNFFHVLQAWVCNISKDCPIFSWWRKVLIIFITCPVSPWCGSCTVLLAAPNVSCLQLLSAATKSLMIFTSCYNISFMWILTISINYSYTGTRSATPLLRSSSSGMTQ